MAAIQGEAPWSRRKLCLFHMDENVRKHGKGLGEGVLAGVIRMFHKTAFAPTRRSVGNRDAKVTYCCLVRDTTQGAMELP